MISKKRLKERLRDIYAGAGMFWEDQYKCFDDFSLESMCNIIEAIDMRFFEGKRSVILTKPFSLKNYENLDDLTDFIFSLIQEYYE